MDKYLFIGLGGFLGSISRYWLSTFVHKHMGMDFPYGTLAVNVIGCFAIGLLMTIFQEHFVENPNIRLFLVIGILGGFTTFSSFSFDTLALMKVGNFLSAGVNVIVSVMVCLSATWIGYYIGESL